MSKIIDTPFSFIIGDEFGDIYRPYVYIFIFSKRSNEWVPVRMIVDSGADFTLLPRKYAAILGIDLEKECKLNSSSGIGGEEKIYQYKSLPIKIGNWEKKIPVGFLLRDSVPPLLGRLGCLEILKVIFNNKRTVFES